MGTSSKRPRKPKQKLPSVKHVMRYPKQSGVRWRLGGPLSTKHEAEAKAAARAKKPGRLAQVVWRLLGGSDRPPD